MATTICLSNQKGGCGKSSTCFHLSGALASQGYRLLLVDLDPQGSLSQGFLGPDEIERLPAFQTTACLFDEESFHDGRRGALRQTGFEGISVLPANQTLAAFNTPCPEQSGLAQFAVCDFIEDLGSEFDFILVDCPPNLYRCTWTALLAADHVIIPVPPEDFGTQGLRAVHQTVEQARLLNPALRRMGHLVTRYDRRLLIHRAYDDKLRSLYSGLVLSTTIPEASAFKVALACRKPVEFYAPKSKAADLTRSLAREILDRIAEKQTRRVA